MPKSSRLFICWTCIQPGPNLHWEPIWLNLWNKILKMTLETRKPSGNAMTVRLWTARIISFGALPMGTWERTRTWTATKTWLGTSSRCCSLETIRRSCWWLHQARCPLPFVDCAVDNCSVCWNFFVRFWTVFEHFLLSVRNIYMVQYAIIQFYRWKYGNIVIF